MLTASFTATQSEFGVDLTIKDTTDYSQEAKSSFNNRVLTIQRADGTLYPQGQSIPFSYFDYPTDTITIPNVDRDYAFTITLELTPETELPGSFYKRPSVRFFNNYLMQFLFALNQEIAANPHIFRKANFAHNYMELLINNACAKNAIAVGSVTSAQFALERAHKLMANKKLYY